MASAFKHSSNNAFIWLDPSSIDSTGIADVENDYIVKYMCPASSCGRAIAVIGELHWQKALSAYRPTTANPPQLLPGGTRPTGFRCRTLWPSLAAAAADVPAALGGDGGGYYSSDNDDDGGGGDDGGDGGGGGGGGGGSDGGGGGGGGDGGDGGEHTRQPVLVTLPSEDHWIVPGPKMNLEGPPPPEKLVNDPDG